MTKQLKIISLIFIGGASIVAFATGVPYVLAQSDATSSRSPNARFTIGPRHVVEIENPDWRQNVSLKTLVRESQIIVLGEIIRNSCKKSNDEQKVTTDYEVQVESTLKGNFAEGALLTVSTPGGLVLERDGSILDVRALGVRKMQNGKRFVLFLKEHPTRTNVLIPLRGSQGIFEVPSSGTIVHLGRSSADYSGEEGADPTAFIQQVRQLISKR